MSGNFNNNNNMNMNNRPAPGFRLNAPQAEDDYSDMMLMEDEVSAPFGMIGEDIEDPRSGVFMVKQPSVNNNNNNNNNDNNNNTIGREQPLTNNPYGNHNYYNDNSGNNNRLPPPIPPPPSSTASASAGIPQAIQTLPPPPPSEVYQQQQQQQQQPYQQYQQQRQPQSYPMKQQQQQQSMITSGATNNNNGTTAPLRIPVANIAPPSRFPLKCLIAVGVLVIVLLIGLIVAVALALGGGGGGGGRSSPSPSSNMNPQQPPSVSPPSTPSILVPTISPTPSIAGAPSMNGNGGGGPGIPTVAPIPQEPTQEPQTTLGWIKQRGVLRCGISTGKAGFSMTNILTGEWEGFDVDLCRAVAAALFEDDVGHIEYVPVSGYDRFYRLLNDDYDLLCRTTTHTMQRHIYEGRTQRGFSFSIPYLYNGLQFAGQMPYVGCADNLTIAEGFCQDLRICALDGTTHVDLLPKLLPGVQLVSTVSPTQLQSNFVQGLCNVIAGEQFDITEVLVRDLGYDGEYEYGRKIHSKEPLAIATRDDDPEWSDFVNWVLQGLLSAEDEGISSRTSNIIPLTSVFGDDFQGMFRNSVRSVGNYGEIYRRHLEDLLPRPIPDRINSGDSGLIYAFPFGGLNDAVGPGPTPGGSLERIIDRGHLRCGISRRVIFAQFDAATQSWSGFDVDFCRALSAAIFDGVTDSVVYTDLPASERFQALQSGNVDVLSRLTTVTLSRDVREPATEVGFQFSQPNFYDGLTFGGIPPFAQCADRLDVTSISCRDLLICVNQGTTFESRLKDLFPVRFIVPRQSGELTVEGLVSGACNVVAGGVVDVSLTSIRNTGYTGPYQTGLGRYSKDPLALVTRQDDEQWSKFVFWVVSAIFYAEEEGITKATANEMPLVSLFGPLFFNMFRDAVGAVGNYGEIYANRAQADVPRGGLNLVNEKLSGPQHYPLPGAV